jgi:hypothetical protein
MDRYNVVLVQPVGYLHALGLVEIGRLLLHSFQSLGHACSFQINRFDPQAVNVVLGYHLLPESGLDLPERYVVYQLEQLGARPEWLRPDQLAILRRAEQVWDYAAENVAFLAERGFDRLRLLPIGFHEKLQTIERQPPDLDVLFFGSLNGRRRAILSQLAARHSLKSLFGVYGDARDQYIARSKIVINVHYHEAQPMEQVRLSYLLNNRCCVLSENATPNPYEGAILTAGYHNLVECCRELLACPATLDRIAQQGFEFFRRRKMVDALAQAMQGGQ